MNGNSMKVLITSRSQQDWQRIYNLVELVEEAVVIHPYIDVMDTPECIRRFMPDVLIIDIDLHHGNGISLVKRALLEYPDLEVIVLSDNSTPQHRKACEHAGASYFFDRSTECRQITLVLNTLVQKSSSINSILS